MNDYMVKRRPMLLTVQRLAFWCPSFCTLFQPYACHIGWHRNNSRMFQRGQTTETGTTSLLTAMNTGSGLHRALQQPMYSGFLNTKYPSARFLFFSVYDRLSPGTLHLLAG